MMAEALAGPLQRAIEEEAAAAAGQLRHSSRRQDERLEVRRGSGMLDAWLSSSCPVGGLHALCAGWRSTHPTLPAPGSNVQGMLPPMVPGNTESPTTVCAMQVRFGGD